MQPAQRQDPSHNWDETQSHTPQVTKKNCFTPFKDYVKTWVGTAVPYVGTSIFISLCACIMAIREIAVTALALLTLGTSPKINAYTQMYSMNAGKILHVLFFATLGLINPYVWDAVEPSATQANGLIQHLIASKFVFKKINQITHACLEYRSKSDQPSFFANHVVTRVAYLLGAAALAATKTVELAFGIFLIPLAFLTVGYFPKFNELVKRHLSALDGIHYVCQCLRLAVNPYPATC